MSHKKKSNNKIVLWSTLIAVSLGGIVALSVYQKSQPGEYDTFAACIAESGATFYGAFWCPACQTQEKMFGRSAKLLPYVECSTPDRRGQTPACIEAGIVSYPTWRFVDGSEAVGVQSFAALADKTGCSIIDTDQE